MSAELSADGRYRYVLRRAIQQPLLTDSRDEAVLFVMLNPSTADANQDDPTIRRCMGFAERWGFGELLVANLYALRATDPAELERADDPIGPHNDGYIVMLANDASLSVAAWGANSFVHPERAAHVAYLLERVTPLKALRLTQDGHPEHPLYVPAGVEPVDYHGPTYENVHA